MDAIISSALEELCSAGPTGITLPLLFSRLAPSISLSLTPSVKQSIWTNLLAVPSLVFHNNSINQPIPTSDIQSLKHAENIDLSIVANDSLRDCFVGVYDVKSRDGFKGFSADMRNTLQLLASARGNGITQSQLAREFGKGGNGIFYTLKDLESRGLVTRQTAVVHTSQEGDMGNKTAVTTNMVYLNRYAKSLGSQQRLEINQEKRSRCVDSEGGMNKECVMEDVSVKDYVPAMKAICDKLAAADEKELFVKDIKQALGYRNERAHKVWRNVCQRLIDAGLVKKSDVDIDNKLMQTSDRLKLLREFSEKNLKTKYSEAYTEDWNVDQANQNNRVISEQLVELPLENQIYDMIDSTGSKGLTLVELCDRLGINNKRYYNTFISIFIRYGMPCREEGHKKGMVYRVWTTRNLTADSSNTNLGLQADDSASRDAVADNVSETWDPTCNDRLPTNADEDNTAGKVRPLNTSTRIDLFEISESGNDKGMYFSKGDTDQQLTVVDMENVTDIVTSERIPRTTTVSLGKLPHHKDPSLAAKREQRILERLEEDKFILRAKLQRWLESLETDKHSAMDSKTLDRLLGKLQKQGLCKCCKIHIEYVVLHPSIQLTTPEIAGQIREKLRFREQECRTRVKKISEDDLPILEAKLCKRLENADPEAKLSVKDSEKIAEDLDPAAQQVLAYMNKGMNRDQIGSTNGLEDIMDQFEHPKSHCSSSRKRQRHPKSDSADHDACTNKCSIVDQFVKDENSFAGHNENQSSGSMAHLENCLSEKNSKPPHVDDGEDKHHLFARQSLYQTRKTRVSWHPEADRHLVIQYARYRAARGPRFHSVKWTALENLPALPIACKRRMALLKGNPDISTALMKLLDILCKKYVKYLEKSKCKQLIYCNGRTTVRDLTSPEPLEEGGDVEEKWDDFDCEDIKTALDEVLQHTQVSKLQKDDEGQRNKKRQRKNFSGNQGRARIPGKLVKAISKGARGCKQIYESLAVSNAVELFKLVFMSTLVATEVPNFVETWRKYSEQDLFAAFKYLREKKILVGGTGGTSFELSQCFLQRISASPFPADTGERASLFYNWIQEKENDLFEEGINLIPDLECGGILELFSRVATGELSVMPCLPYDGVGEPEESIDLKRQADNGDLSNERKAKRPKRSSVVESELVSRREKGFPGMKVIINRTVFSSVSSMGGIPYMKNWNGNDKHHQKGHELNSNLIPTDNLEDVLTRSHTNHVISDLDASPWEAMVEYAACLTLKSSDQTLKSAFHSEMFKDIYEAIKMAGDQGLTLNEISDFVDKQGKSLGVKNAGRAIEILQSFGLTIQVNAYDTVHVVDSQHQSKYFLPSVTGPTSGLQHPSKYQDVNASTDLVTLKDRHAANDGSEFPATETGVDNSHAHSVTILDAPAEVALSSNENLSTHGNTWVNIWSASSGSYVPILPWMNANGTINKSIYMGLVRRVVGSIMQNPGMLEGDIIQRMDVLNPQSCRRLLELLILEKHLILRRKRQVRAGQGPSILGCLLKKRPSEDVVWREHFFVNPASSHLL